MNSSRPISALDRPRPSTTATSRSRSLNRPSARAACRRRASAPLADLYHAPGATPADRATVVALWQANQGLFDELLLVGLVLVAAGLVARGSAMAADPAFGRWVGGAGVLLGVVGLGAGAAVLADPYSPAAALGLFALIAFHLVAGIRVHRLARSA